MPKQKSNRAAMKRFKLSGSGKAIARRSGLRHGMISKNRSNKRKKGVNVVVAAPDQARVQRMLGQR